MTQTLGVIAGVVLCFLCFAAIFVGSWLMLIFFLLLYAAAGAIAVRFGRAQPRAFALAIAAPSLLLVLWLFPASMMEAGLLRGLLWPALGLLVAALAFLGGRLAETKTLQHHSRRGTSVG